MAFEKYWPLVGLEMDRHFQWSQKGQVGGRVSRDPVRRSQQENRYRDLFLLAPSDILKCGFIPDIPVFIDEPERQLGPAQTRRQ